ncbi:MAG: Fe-S cluster assembly protein SufD [Dehalococcoidia bacterium]|nr:Fe-S cluster assembly protein SufD [Dehalococcoidia bacterium]
MAGAHAAHYAPEQAVSASRDRGEPSWLADARAEAARAFDVTPMPTPALRPWKYTNVAGLVIDSFAPDARFAPVVEGAAPEGGFAGTNAHALLDAAQASVVQQHLGAVVKATEGKFVAANAALWTAGAFIHAPRGKAFAGPVSVTLEAGEGAIFPRVLIVAEAGSEVSVIIHSASGDAALLASTVVEVVAQADARVRLAFDVRWGDQTQEFALVRTRADRGSDVKIDTLAIGGHLVKQAFECLLEGEGATSTIRGVALGDRDQHFDFVTYQDHIAPRTVSSVGIKVALAGHSRAAYYGVTRVEETAKGADAVQENRNMLLSRHAKADSDPVLEILTNDVTRCGHGATVGPVDKDALFYLQSRGLDNRAAMKLLVAGFFASVLQDINDPVLEADLAAEVERKLSVADY